jgi:acetyl esterase/lipase
MSLVNPELRAPLEVWNKKAGGFQELNATVLKQDRKELERYRHNHHLQSALPNPPVKELFIPGPPGAPKVRILLVGASPGASKPAVLHIHGGGYVLGTPDTDLPALQALSNTHDCVVVSVDYRLAPETRFPGSLEDNYAALRWMYTNAKDLGVDVKRIAIKGESAGGGHAAALAIAARDRGEIPICLQVLIYPMLDDRTGSSRQVSPCIGHFVWTPADNRFGWTALLGVPAGSANVPKNSVPARVTNLAGLAPAFIGVGSIDLFSAEDLEYAKRLLEAGVPTEFNLVPGAYHGFDFAAPESSLVRQFNTNWNTALSRAFEKG